MSNDLAALVPANVVVAFPATGAFAPSNGFVTYTVNLAGLSLTEFSGILGVPFEGLLHRYEQAVCSSSSTPDNDAALTALATQFVTDWYTWQLAGVFQTWVGIADWTPEAMHDLAFMQGDGKATTEVRRGAFNPTEDLLYTSIDENDASIIKITDGTPSGGFYDAVLQTLVATSWVDGEAIKAKDVDSAASLVVNAQYVAVYEELYSGNDVWAFKSSQGSSGGSIITNPATSTATGPDYTFMTGVTGDDFNIDAEVLTGISTVIFNLPDASYTARGVVNITTQSFSGSKTFGQTSALVAVTVYDTIYAKDAMGGVGTFVSAGVSGTSGAGSWTLSTASAAGDDTAGTTFTLSPTGSGGVSVAGNAQWAINKANAYGLDTNTSAEWQITPSFVAGSDGWEVSSAGLQITGPLAYTGTGSLLFSYPVNGSVGIVATATDTVNGNYARYVMAAGDGDTIRPEFSIQGGAPLTDDTYGFPSYVVTRTTALGSGGDSVGIWALPGTPGTDYPTVGGIGHGIGWGAHVEGGIVTDPGSDSVPLEGGGTEADLSATGPGIVVQASMGVPLSVSQQADVGALTDSTGGSASSTIAAVSGTGDDSTINDNNASFAAQLNAIRSALQALGAMA